MKLYYVISFLFTYITHLLHLSDLCRYSSLRASYNTYYITFDLSAPTPCPVRSP